MISVIVPTLWTESAMAVDVLFRVASHFLV